MPLAYVAGRAGTTYNIVVPVRQAGNRFLGSFKDLQIRAQESFQGIDSASLAGRYDNSVPTRFLAPIYVQKF
jgi:hypothetical protein